MALRELVVAIGFEVDEKQLKTIESTVSQLKTSLFAVGAAASAASAAVFGVVKNAADTSDFIQDTALRLGLTVEQFQKVSFAAELTGVRTEQLAVGFSILSRNVAEASRGNQTFLDLFKKVGVNIRDVNGTVKPTNTLFLEMADRFSKMEAGAEKTGLALRLFGESGGRLIPTLNSGSAGILSMGNQLEEMGAVLSDAEVQLGSDFNDSLSATSVLIKNLFTLVGLQLIPTVKEGLDAFRDWIKVNKDFVRSRITNVMEAFQAISNNVWKVLKAIGTVTYGLVTAFDQLLKPLGGALNLFKALLAAGGLYVLGQIATSVYSLASAFITMGKAAGLANLKVLAIPILVGAAIAGVVLLVEDFVGFMEGRPSLLGYLVKNKDKILADLKQAIGNAASTVASFFGASKEDAAAWSEFLKSEFDSLLSIVNDMLTGFKAIGDVLVTAFTKPQELVEDMKLALQGVWETLKDASGALSFLGFTPAPEAGRTPALAPTGSPASVVPQASPQQILQSTVPAASPLQSRVNNNATQSNQIAVTVNVPDSAPAGIGEATAEAIRKALDEEFFSTQQSVQPAVSY